MSTGGLTGTGGGSIAGTAPPPPAKQPDGASLISYAQASSPKPEGAKREGGSKAGTDTKAGGDGWAQSEEQSQKLQDFDAVRGRPDLGDKRQDDGQESEREGSFMGCAAGAAKDVVVGTVKGAYEIARDAGGAVLDKAGVNGFEGHTERTAERVDAAVDGGKKVIGAGVDAGGAVLDKAGVDGFEGHSERTAARAETAKDAIVDEGAEIMAEIDNGDSCALGERVGTTVGVGATIVIPGGALVKGGKVLAKMGGKDGADQPEAKPSDSNESGRTPTEKRTMGGVDYDVTTDKVGWGKTARETRTVDESIQAKSEGKQAGARFEAETAKTIRDNGIQIEDMGRREFKPTPNENDELGEIDIETKDHTIEVKSGRFRTKDVRKYAENEQLHRDKQPVLYAPGENIRPGDIAKAEEAGLKVATSPEQLIAILNGEQ